MYAKFKGDRVEVLIPFECEMCGKCCENLSQCVYLPKEKKLILENDVIVSNDVIEQIHIESNYPILIKPCPFYRDKRCTIYPNRPRSCREFPLTKELDMGIGCPALKKVFRVIGEIERRIGKLEFEGKV